MNDWWDDEVEHLARQVEVLGVGRRRRRQERLDGRPDGIYHFGLERA